MITQLERKPKWSTVIECGKTNIIIHLVYAQAKSSRIFTLTVTGYP